jgi:glutathione S-transferase
MKLHGGPISPFVRKVGICLIEKQLEGACYLQRSPTAIVEPNLALMRDNPLSKIPTLITDDGMALFDSDVICEYLDIQFPTPRLIPPLGDARWRALRWNALGSGTLDALVLWRFERNRPTERQSVATLGAYSIKLQATLAQIEAEMPALAETPFGIGHIALGCVFGYLDFRFADSPWRAKHPRAATWYSQLLQRPSVRRTTPFEGAAPAGHLWINA